MEEQDWRLDRRIHITGLFAARRAVRVCETRGALVALWVLIGTAATAAPCPPGARASAINQPIRVRLIDNVGLPANVKEVASQQIDAIWSSHGVLLDASARPAMTAGSLDAVYVLMRHRTPIDVRARGGEDRLIDGGGVASDAEGPIGLAWMPFESKRPGSVIFVSLDHIQQLLRVLEFEGRRPDRCPENLEQMLLGRAIGRVIAHEIGHYLGGPSHAARGLMKPLLSGEDLLGAIAPELLLVTPMIRCEPDHAVTSAR